MEALNVTSPSLSVWVDPVDSSDPLSGLKLQQFNSGVKQETINLLKNAGICVDNDSHVFVDYKIIHEHLLNTPIRKLYVAILLQALNDLFRPNSHHLNHSKEYITKSKMIQREALLWILSESYWERSFNTVCEFLGFNPSFLRTKIIYKFKVDQAAQKERNKKYQLIRRNGRRGGKALHSIQLKR